MLTLRFKKLTNTMKVPQKAHPTDACFDIYADVSETVQINPHCTTMIKTGFACDIPHGYWGAIFARSGLASKNGLRPAQGVPVIDEPYKGEWIIPIHNDSNDVQYVKPGDRICQFTLQQYFDTELVEVEELEESDRGIGGFGSTGN